MTHNLQGIIRQSSINLGVQFDRLGYCTQNIGNLNTTAYKAVRFEDVIDADGSVYGVERIDTRPGEYLQTNNPLDIALTDAGYIPVVTPQGEIRYTRDGAFMTNKDGLLTTKTGDIVGGGIFIDSSAEKNEIRPNGDVYTYKRLQDEPEYVGTIPVVQFQNPEGLKDVGSNEFIPTEESGNMKLVEDHTMIKQYGVEHSNLDAISEVYLVSRINASVIATTQLMGAIDTMYRTAIDNMANG